MLIAIIVDVDVYAFKNFTVLCSSGSTRTDDPLSEASSFVFLLLYLDLCTRSSLVRMEDDSSRHRQDMHVSFVPYRLAAAYLRQRLEETDGMVLPTVGIVCGSGLAGLSEALDADAPKLVVKYAEIPGFPGHCTVHGHKEEVVFGKLAGGVPAVCFRGRFHAYEGHDMKTVVLPVTVMRCLGVQVCIVTNAAGGLHPDYSVGDVVAVSDHLAIPQLAGNNPLVGPNDDDLGPRFPATSNCYDPDLRKIAKAAADHLGMDFLRTHGTYCFVSGPMFESKAECRFLRTLGGDCVGMSTIPEIVVAHHCDMKTLCLSLVTNNVVMEGDEGAAVANHAEVLEAAQNRSEQLQLLVKQIVAEMKASRYLDNLPRLKRVSHRVPLRAQKTFEEFLDDVNEYGYKASKKSSRFTVLSLPNVALGGALVGLGAVIGLLASKKGR